MRTQQDHRKPQEQHIKAPNQKTISPQHHKNHCKPQEQHIKAPNQKTISPPHHKTIRPYHHSTKPVQTIQSCRNKDKEQREVEVNKEKQKK
jgi:hypothetical protein